MNTSFRSLLCVYFASLVAVVDSTGTELPPGVPDIVTISTGQVKGIAAGTANLKYYLAIPYAASTAGVNMFRPPQPRTPWTGVLDCTNWGAGCIQSHHNPDVPANTSFDCLNVNVFTPYNATSSSLLPVMVFIHGGAWLEGSNQGPFFIYSGGYIASQQNVIVVSLNYRLGVFGWLTLGTTATGEVINGNFGIMDEVAALQWVQTNIGAFGGDPKQVTIYGESAGGMSIGILLTSPKAEGLFSKGIMESNVGGFNYKNITEASVYGSTFCSAVNCTTSVGLCNTSCLRDTNPYVLESAWNDATGNVPDFIITNLGHILDGLLGTGPTIDGEWLPVEPLDSVEGGNYWGKNIPLLIGTNTNEGETFIYAGVDFALPNFLIPLAYVGLFDFNETAAKLVDTQPRYNSSAYTDGRTPLSQVVTDYWFACATQKFLQSAYRSTVPTYAYRYNHVYSNSSIFPTFGLPEICATAVCHASELPFVFHNVPNFTSFTPVEDTLSASMVTYWTNFAKYGNPNGNGQEKVKEEGLFVWPPWEPVNRNRIVLDTTFTVESTSEMCGFWDSLGGYFF